MNMPPYVSIISGANSGIGLEIAKELAVLFAKEKTKYTPTIILAVRNLVKGEAAVAEILAENPTVKNKVNLEAAHLDLADLNSVYKFADAIKAKYKEIDLLINNAGVMNIPFANTAQGYEMQFGVNYLAHFALTTALLRNMAPEGKIITMSSMVARNGKINFASFQTSKDYRPRVAYSQSKLANLVFGLELARRLENQKSSVQSIVVHPGLTNTNLFNHGRGKMSFSTKMFLETFAMPVRGGAESTIMAITNPEVNSGDFLGPQFMAFGKSVKIKPFRNALKADLGRQLWQESERLVELAPKGEVLEN